MSGHTPWAIIRDRRSRILQARIDAAEDMRAQVDRIYADMDDCDGDDDRGVALDPGKEPREILGSYATWERFLVWTGYRVWFGKIGRTAYGIVHGRCADCHGLICGEGDYCWKCQRPLCCGCEYICRNCRGCEPSWCSDQENCAWIDPICTCKSGGLL